MRRLLFWLRWSARDLRDRWLLVAAIAATIAMGTGMYAALESMGAWRKDASLQSLALLQAHDVRLYLEDGSFATPEQLRALVAEIPHASSVAGAEARLALPTRVDASFGDQTVVVPGRLVGMPTGDPSVDRLQIRSGRGLTEADDGQLVAEIEYHFATHYDLPVPGAVKVADGQTVAVVGDALSPDYLLVISPAGDFMAEANYAAVFVPLQTAGRIAGHPGMANELVVRLSDPSLAPVVRDELAAAAAAALPNLGAAVVASDDETVRRWLDRDAQNDESFFALFAVLMLGGATFAAFNLTTRIVESQRRQVGIGLALGLPARTLAIRPLAVAAEIALLGVVLGIGIGLLIDLGMKAVFASMLPMPVMETPFQPDTFASAAAIGFVLPFAASIYPVWRAVRSRPVDAIRTGYLSAKRPGLARLARRLPLPAWLRLPLSNVLRTPRRTVLTALGVAAAVTVLIGTIGMLDTFSVGMDQGQAEMIGGSPDRIAVDLTTPLPADTVRQNLASAPGVGRVDLVLRLPATAMAAGRASIDIQLDVLDLNDNAWRASVAEGRLPSGPGEVMLSQRAADDLGLKPGDRFVLRHPVRVTDTAVAIAETDVELVGTNPSPLRPTAYMDSSGASLFGMVGLANRATVVPATGADAGQLRRALFGLPGVVSAQPIDALVTSMRDMVTQFTDILGVVALVALILALLVAYNSATIAQDERRREVATALAFGLPIRRVLGSAMVESGLIGLLGTLVGIVAGFGALSWLVFGLLPTSMPEFALTPAISPGTVVLAVLVGIVVVGLAPALTWRRLTRMDLPATLRVVE
ncbi:MAG: FtsX-like permease family protein [Candidatus Limnocylindrales bacterium]